MKREDARRKNRLLSAVNNRAIVKEGIMTGDRKQLDEADIGSAINLNKQYEQELSNHQRSS